MSAETSHSNKIHFFLGGGVILASTGLGLGKEGPGDAYIILGAALAEFCLVQKS